MPKILNFVKIIHYYSKLFTGVLRLDANMPRSSLPPEVEEFLKPAVVVKAKRLKARAVDRIDA